MSMDDLRISLRGEVIAPSDGKYDEALALYNGMIDKRPAMIARCVDSADVMAAVNHARQNGTLVVVRGGGTTAPAWAAAMTGW